MKRLIFSFQHCFGIRLDNVPWVLQTHYAGVSYCSWRWMIYVARVIYMALIYLAWLEGLCCGAPMLVWDYTRVLDGHTLIGRCL